MLKLPGQLHPCLHSSSHPRVGKAAVLPYWVFLSCESPLLSHRTFLVTSDHQMRLFPHKKQFCDISWVSYNVTQFRHYPEIASDPPG